MGFSEGFTGRQDDPGLEDALSGNIDVTESAPVTPDVAESEARSAAEATESKMNAKLDSSPVSEENKDIIGSALGKLKETYESALGALAKTEEQQISTVSQEIQQKLDNLEGYDQNMKPFQIKSLVLVLKNEEAVRKAVGLETYGKGSGDFVMINAQLDALGIDDEGRKSIQRFLGVDPDGGFGPGTINALSQKMGWGIEVKLAVKTKVMETAADVKGEVADVLEEAQGVEEAPELSEEQMAVAEKAREMGLKESHVKILVDQKAPLFVLNGFLYKAEGEEREADGFSVARLTELLQFEEKQGLKIFQKQSQLYDELKSRAEDKHDGYERTDPLHHDLSKIMDNVNAQHPKVAGLLRHVFVNVAVMKNKNMMDLYNSPNFQAAVALLKDGRVTKPEVALKIGSEIVEGEDLARKSGSDRVITTEMIDQYLEKDYLNGVSLFKDRNVLVASSNERYYQDDGVLVGARRFGSEDLKGEIKNRMGDGGELDAVTTEDDSTEQEIANKKREMLAKIVSMPSPLTFFFDGHGDKGNISISHSSKEAGMITARELAKAIAARNKRTDVDTSKDAYVFDECFANDFISKVRKELRTLGSGTEASADKGFFLTSIPPGQYSDEAEKQKSGAYASLLESGEDLGQVDKKGKYYFYKV